jgi:hypothetical protein
VGVATIAIGVGVGGIGVGVATITIGVGVGGIGVGVMTMTLGVGTGIMPHPVRMLMASETSIIPDNFFMINLLS